MCNFNGTWKAKCIELKEKQTELESMINPPPGPAIFEEVTKEQIAEILNALFPGKQDNIFYGDNKYKVTAISELRRFVSWDNVNIFPYEAEWHDCDDFAYALAGDFAKYPAWSPYPVSFVFGKWDTGKSHAFIIAIAWPDFDDRTLTPYYIEPQSDVDIDSDVLRDMELMLLPI